MNGTLGLPRKLLYILGALILFGLNVIGVMFTGRLPGLTDVLGFLIVIAVIFIPPYLYRRLPNGTGTLRGLEHGSKWQFQEYVKRQSALTQFLYEWINRLRVACLGAMIGGALPFCGAVAGLSMYTAFLGWFVAAVAWPLWWVLNGTGTLVVRAGNFPRELLVGKREFVLGHKAIFGGISRIVIGVLMLGVPLNFIYWAYLLVTGQLGEVIMQSLRQGY